MTIRRRTLLKGAAGATAATIASPLTGAVTQAADDSKLASTSPAKTKHNQNTLASCFANLNWTQRYGNPYEVSYAESTDGIHWHKPDLGVLEVDGSRKNNRVNFYGHSASVIDRGPDAPPEQRYMGIGVGYAPLLGVPEVLEHPTTKKHHGYWAYYSADGIHWNIYPPPSCGILN